MLDVRCGFNYLEKEKETHRNNSATVILYWSEVEERLETVILYSCSEVEERLETYIYYTNQFDTFEANSCCLPSPISYKTLDYY